MTKLKVKKDDAPPPKRVMFARPPLATEVLGNRDLKRKFDQLPGEIRQGILKLIDTGNPNWLVKRLDDQDASTLEQAFHEAGLSETYVARTLKELMEGQVEKTNHKGEVVTITDGKLRLDAVKLYYGVKYQREMLDRKSGDDKNGDEKLVTELFPEELPED